MAGPMINGRKSGPDSAGAGGAIQVQQKYGEERSKRLRSDGNAQYVDLSTSEKFRHFRDDPWIDPHASVGSSPVTDGSDCKYLILGAGFGGLLVRPSR